MLRSSTPWPFDDPAIGHWKISKLGDPVCIPTVKDRIAIKYSLGESNERCTRNYGSRDSHDDRLKIQVRGTDSTGTKRSAR